MYNVTSMLQLSATLTNAAVLSLRTGSPVTQTTEPIINPTNLKIEGFYCPDPADRKRKLVLLHQDIREVIPRGFVINDADVLSDPTELIRLQEILSHSFTLLGKQVVTANGDKIGKVTDYSTETSSMFIQKLYVTQSIFKSMSSNSLGIDRTQIVEITDKRIVVHDLTQTVPARAGAAA